MAANNVHQNIGRVQEGGMGMVAFGESMGYYEDRQRPARPWAMVLDTVWWERRAQYKSGGGLQHLQEQKERLAYNLSAAMAILHNKKG